MAAVTDPSKSSVKFDLFDISTFRLFAASRGFDDDDVSDDGAACLTEDLNYRLREMAHESSLFMNQKRRRKLTVDDFNLTLKWHSCPSIIGHKSMEPPKLHFIKELNLFVPNEGSVDLLDFALSRVSTSLSKDSNLQALHLPAVDGGSTVVDEVLVDLCKKSLIELFSLPRIEFLKSLNAIVKLNDAKCLCIIANILVNLLKSSNVEHLLIRSVILLRSIFETKLAEVALLSKANSVVNVLLDVAVTNNRSPEFIEKCSLLLFQLEKNFRYIFTKPPFDSVITRLFRLLERTENDVAKQLNILRILNVFQFDLDILTFAKAFFTHFEKCSNGMKDVNENDSSILVEYRTIFVGIVNRWLSGMNLYEYSASIRIVFSLISILSAIFGDAFSLNIYETRLDSFLAEDLTNTTNVPIGNDENCEEVAVFDNENSENTTVGQDERKFETDSMKFPKCGVGIERATRACKRKTSISSFEMSASKRIRRKSGRQTFTFIYQQDKLKFVEAPIERMDISQSCEKSPFAKLFNRNFVRTRKMVDIIRRRDQRLLDDVRTCFL